METGPRPMFQAMEGADNSHGWQNRETAVRELIAWWKGVSSYDPDMEPEGLLQHARSALSKEVLGVAAARRVRPAALSFDIPTDKETQAWLSSHQAKTLRQALEVENTGDWWNRCLFEDAKEMYHARTEHLVRHLMHDHPFVHMSVGLNLPLAELLPMLDTNPSLSVPENPTLPDLC